MRVAALLIGLTVAAPAAAVTLVNVSGQIGVSGRADIHLPIAFDAPSSPYLLGIRAAVPIDADYLYRYGIYWEEREYGTDRLLREFGNESLLSAASWSGIRQITHQLFGTYMLSRQEWCSETSYCLLHQYSQPAWVELRGQPGNVYRVRLVQTGVPEPVVWALWLTGFGLVGMSARRLRRAAVS